MIPTASPPTAPPAGSTPAERVALLDGRSALGAGLSRWVHRPGLRARWFRPGKVPLALSVLVVLLVVGWAVWPGLFAGVAPTAVDPIHTLLAPSWHFPFGTDQYGRSVYTEVVYGARPALTVGFACTLIGGGLGSLVGIVSGYAGGWVDTLLMRLVDMLMALPPLFLALIFIAALPPTLTNEIVAVSIATIPAFARVLRSRAVEIRSRLFVDALRVVGVRNRRVLIRHVIPNCVAPAVVLASINVGLAIVIGASLSFLGLGPSTKTSSWGALVSSGQGYIDKDWWIAVFPGLLIALLVIALNVIGDWLRDVMEPASQ